MNVRPGQRGHDGEKKRAPAATNLGSVVPRPRTRHPCLSVVIWKELQAFAHGNSPAYAELRKNWNPASAESAECMAALIAFVSARIGVTSAVTAPLIEEMLRSSPPSFGTQRDHGIGPGRS